MKIKSLLVVSLAVMLLTGCTAVAVPKATPTASPHAATSPTITTLPAATKPTKPKPTMTKAITTTPVTTVPATTTAPVTDSKSFNGTVILGRPTEESITLSLLTASDTDIFVQYGKNTGVYESRTGVSHELKDQPLVVELTGLVKDTQYYYRICHRTAGETGFAAAAENTFHTQRIAGESFVFTIDADPHFDSNSDTSKVQLAFQNIMNVRPDFDIDLGDTFMSEKLGLQSYAQVAADYVDKRTDFSIFGSSVPLYLAIGNHDGEAGGALNGTENNMAIWASKARTLYYLNPFPDSFYSGDTREAPFVGLRANYYSWVWGDALFVVLDPYWYSAGVKGVSGWDVSLGKAQYDWLKTTLETSTAKYKFVFSHNLIGGMDMGSDGKSRGGAEAAAYYEWGGKNADGTWGFDKYRPGWGEPIQQLLAENHVTIFFHGHDHLFARQELDGVIYQECPQPGSKGDKNSAVSYGYKEGVVISSPGFIRVTVSDSGLVVDYVKTYLPTEETATHKNGEIAFSYSIPK
jgi:hypothetical protein